MTCYHQSTDVYDEFEDADGNIIYETVEECRDCKMIIYNGQEMGINS